MSQIISYHFTTYYFVRYCKLRNLFALGQPASPIPNLSPRHMEFTTILSFPTSLLLNRAVLKDNLSRYGSASQV